MATLASLIGVRIIGSAGAWTFQTGRGGRQVVREKPNPAWAGTSPQQVQSAAWSNAHAQWSSIGQSERDKWEAYAETLARPDGRRFGAHMGRYVFLAYAFSRFYLRAIFSAAFSGSNSFAVPSYQHYLLFNAKSAPVLPATPTTARILIINLDAEPLVCGAWLSPPMNKTVNYYKGPWNMTLRGRVQPAPGASATLTIAGATVGSRHFWIARATTRTQTGAVYPARRGLNRTGFIDF